MGYFWPFFTIFSKPLHFLALMNKFEKEKWPRNQNYNQLSFKRNKNEVKRIFLAPSKNYHASTSAKINLVLELRHIPNFWYGSCSYGPLSENHTLFAGKF